MSLFQSSLTALFQIPKLYVKYVGLNVKSTSGYKGYQSNIPLYLHNRPRSLVVYLLHKKHSITERMIKSVRAYESEESKYESDSEEYNINGIYMVAKPPCSI